MTDLRLCAGLLRVKHSVYLGSHRDAASECSSHSEVSVWRKHVFFAAQEARSRSQLYGIQHARSGFQARGHPTKPSGPSCPNQHGHSYLKPYFSAPRGEPD